MQRVPTKVPTVYILIIAREQAKPLTQMVFYGTTQIANKGFADLWNSFVPACKCSYLHLLFYTVGYMPTTPYKQIQTGTYYRFYYRIQVSLNRSLPYQFSKLIVIKRAAQAAVGILAFIR